jgi:peptide/nickel transport system substrate-binding protein
MIPRYPLTFNPQLATDMLSSDVLYPLYNSLFTYNKGGEIITDIIKEYRWINNKSFSFNIKKGLKFSDGSSITNKTIVENLKYFIDKKRNFPYSSQFDFINKIMIKNGDIYIFLKYPFAPLLSYLTIKIIPEKYLGKNMIIPSSTGFIIKNKTKDGFSYKSGKRQWNFNICPDEITAVLKLINNEADILYGYKINDDKFKRKNINSKKYILNSLYYLVFNMRNKKFKKYANRCLIKKLLKFDDFYRILKNQYHYSFYPILNPVFKIEENIKTDYNCSGNLKTVGILINSESELRKKYAEIIKTLLENSGIKTDIFSLEYGIYLQRLKHGNFEIALGAFVFDYDPDQRDIWQTKGFMNYSGLSDKEIDNMLHTGVTIIDIRERIKFYKTIYKKIMEKIPIIFLPSPLYSVYYRKGVLIEIPELIHSNSSVLNYLKTWSKKEI